MCGVAGIVEFSDQSGTAVGDVRTMCDVMRHRGPDGGAVLADGNAVLGHRRLSIVDLSDAGRQPMESTDGRLVIVFNGEVYNHVEIRSQLESLGVRFSSRTDTEVVLEAYRRWGQECVERFNGMWAFAILDRVERKLFLSRDRLGIKPLYLYRPVGEFVFASEIKGILAVRPDAARPNEPYLSRFLVTGLRDDGAETCFGPIRCFPAAHTAVLDLLTGGFESRRYWRVEPGGEYSGGVGEAAEELRDLLKSSIGLRLRSDVPVGSCLSGGVDSSTIVGVASTLRDDPLHTFTGEYDSPGCNEAGYAYSVNAHVGAEACPVRPNPAENLLEDLERIVWHQDEPTAGPGLYTQFQVMRRAHQDVKVVLDGQGGDELFAGYLFHFNARVSDLLGRGRIRGRLAALPVLTSIARHWGVGVAPSAFDEFLGGWPRRLMERLSRSTSILHDRFCPVVPQSPSKSAGPYPDSLTNLLYDQTFRTSIPTLLHYEDRNSMAWSIEARVPLLDHRIVEFAFALPAELKIRGSWTKWILRRVATEFVPPRIAWRRSKMGYPTPFAQWLRQDANRSTIGELLFSRSLTEREVFATELLRQRWAEHQNGADHSWLLYRALVTELWYRQFIDEKVTAPHASMSTRILGSAA